MILLILYIHIFGAKKHGTDIFVADVFLDVINYL
jgi:hypothetical protein